MRHQPKQLALLISLIGAGVSPLALAKTDVRIVGMDLSAPRIAIDVPDVRDVRDARALLRARWFAGLAQQIDERALTLPEPWDPSRAEAERLPPDAFDDHSAARPERSAPSEPENLEVASSTDEIDLLLPDGADFVQDDAHSDAAVVAADAPVQYFISSLARSDVAPISAHAVRLLDSLFADEPEALANIGEESNADSSPLPAKRRVDERRVDERRIDEPVGVGAWFTLDSSVATTELVSQVTVKRTRHNGIVVTTQSSVVLRSLQAILSNERDEVGAVWGDLNDAIDLPPGGRMRSAVSGVSSPRAKHETPAARRASKRAAAKLKADAAVALAARFESRAASSVAAGAEAGAGVAVAAREPTPVDIDLGKPPVAEPPIAADSTQDDEQAPLAVATDPWPEIMGVDIDLSAPFVAKPTEEAAAEPTAEPTAPALSVGDDELASPATEAELWPGLMGVDVDLSQPFVSTNPVAAASPGDTEPAVLAMEPPAGPVGSHVDIELPLPLVAQPTTAPASAGDEPALLPVAAVPAPEVDQKFRPSPFGSELVAVSEKALDAVRGGFVTEGLNISFGIERAVYINGSLVTTTSLNMADLGRLTAGRGAPVVTSGTLGLIQSGTGNTVAPGTFSAGSMGTVIQNTLNGQKIQNVTVINATTNSLGLLKGINLESSMRGAISDSLRR